MGGYVATEDMKGLSKYYSQLQADCKKINNIAALNPTVVNDSAIYSILAGKYEKASELGIDINIEIFLDLSTIHMKIYEFTRVLGILLDNAIEAAIDCDEKIINIVMRHDFSNPRQLVVIENTYKEKDVDVEKIYEKGETSKKEKGNTGLGLWEVRQILKKNNNLNLYTHKNDQFFIQQLEIYQ